jgi:hypothetical protein
MVNQTRSMKIQIEKAESFPDPAHQILIKRLWRYLTVILTIWDLSEAVIYSSYAIQP